MKTPLQARFRMPINGENALDWETTSTTPRGLLPRTATKRTPLLPLTPALLVQSSGSGFGGLSLLLPVVLIGFVLLTALPQQRKQKAWNKMLAELKTGDRVTTNGGLRGQILSLKDDSVILRLQPDGIKLEFLRSAIASVTTEDTDTK